jgi:hypothetical protein
MLGAPGYNSWVHDKILCITGVYTWKCIEGEFDYAERELKCNAVLRGIQYIGEAEFRKGVLCSSVGDKHAFAVLHNHRLSALM